MCEVRRVLLAEFWNAGCEEREAITNDENMYYKYICMWALSQHVTTKSSTNDTNEGIISSRALLVWNQDMWACTTVKEDIPHLISEAIPPNETIHNAITNEIVTKLEL